MKLLDIIAEAGRPQVGAVVRLSLAQKNPIPTPPGHGATWTEITGGCPPGGTFPARISQMPKHWWHGTCSTNLPSIEQNGLMPAPGCYLHLTLDRDLARFSARRAAQRWGGDPIVLQIDTTGLDLTLIGVKSDSATSDIIPYPAIKASRLRERKGTP
jgi:hypothetical protein